MKYKLYLLLTLILMIISLPSICFSEMVTVIGEDCYVDIDVKDDVNDLVILPPPLSPQPESPKMTRKRQRELVRHTSIFDGLMKIKMYNEFWNDYERYIGVNLNKPIESQKKSSTLIQEKYLENFKVISHTEKGKKMCEKVKFSIDLDVLQDVINSYKIKYSDKKRDRDELMDRFRKESECRDKGYGIEWLLKSYSKYDKKRIINVGVIVENRTKNRSEVETERLSDEVEKTVSECLSFSTTFDMNPDSPTYFKTIPTNYTKIIERRHLNKILEEQKLSVSGITEGNTVKLGKIENLDVIFLVIIYDDKTTTKLLNVEDGEVMYLSNNKKEDWSKTFSETVK